MKYKEIIKIIKNISLALPDVQSFYTGDVYEINADQSVKYSSVVLTNQEHSFDNINDKFQYNFILFYIDRLTDDENNRTDVHTAAVSALKTIVRHLEDYNVIINDFKFNLFRERFNDSCAGAYASLSVEVEDNDCNEDFDFTYGQISADKLKEISITSNGTYTPDEGYYYTKVNVNVQPQLQNKSVNITENGQRTIEADSDYDGLGSVDINVNIPITEPKLGSLVATQNDYWYIASDEGLDGYEAVNVSVPMPKLIDHTAIYVENGSYSLTPKNADGFSKVNVRVNVPNPQLTVLNATENGHYEAVDSGFYGYSAVEVNVPTPEFTTSELVATENGIYRASEQGVDGFYAVMVDVEPNLQAKAIEITENGTQTISADNGYDGLSSVSVTTNVSGGTTSDKIKLIDGMKLNYNRYVIDYSKFDTSELTDFRYLLANTNFELLPYYASIDLSNWDTASATNMCNLFYNCSGIKSLIGLENWKTNNVELMEDTFNSCNRIAALDLSNWDVSNVTAFSSMFRRAIYLETLNLSGWNMSKATFYNINMFYGCTSLTNLNMDGARLPKSNLEEFGLDSCPLTVESLVSVLNA